MAIYLVTGRLGAGKSLACVGRMRDALMEGRRIATNIDVDLAALFPTRPRGKSVVRLPDKPSVEDLETLGCGNDSMDETQNGVIVLDELATWLNARDWNDKGRQGVIDWLVHSRKKGWDVMFICQDASQIDKQIRASLVEYLVVCRRLDRLRIPLIGALINQLSFGFLSGRLPRIHVAAVRYGTEATAMVADRWTYLGNDLFGAYNTRQVFVENYPHGPHSLVASNYWQSPRPSLLARLRAALARPAARPEPVARPKHRIAVLLSRLPENERIAHWRRFQALGAFD